MIPILALFRLVAFTLLAAWSQPVNAATGIVIPSNFTAGQRELIDVNENLDDDNEYRKTTIGYRVYLALEPPGFGIGPVCWLVQIVNGLETRDVNITIPADVAPDNSKVYISTSLVKKDGTRATGWSYSGSARLQGGNGTWSQRELDGWTMGDQDKVSCMAFGCVRECNVRYYTGDKDRSSNGTASDKELNSCENQCVRDFNPNSAANVNSLPIFTALVAMFILGMAQIL